MACSAIRVMTASKNFPTSRSPSAGKLISVFLCPICLIHTSKPMYTETWKQTPLEFYACVFSQYTVCLKMYSSAIQDRCHISYRNTRQTCSQIWLPESFRPDSTGQNRKPSQHFLSTSLSAMDEQHLLAMATGMHVLWKCWLRGHDKTSVLGAGGLQLKVEPKQGDKLRGCLWSSA